MTLYDLWNGLIWLGLIAAAVWDWVRTDDPE